jgi:AraC-like DNA-binding protein
MRFQREFLARLPFDLTRMPPDVERVLQCIHARLFDATLSVSAVMERCGIRSNGFSSRFKREMASAGLGRLTVRQYIEWSRVEAAKALLLDDDFELAEVAHGLGFEHYETFLRTFRRRTGQSPSAYRNGSTPAGKPPLV